MYVVQSQFWSDLRKEEVDRKIMYALVTCENDNYYLFFLFFDFVQSTRYIKQKDTSPLQGFSTYNKYERILNCIVILFPEI